MPRCTRIARYSPSAKSNAFCAQSVRQLQFCGLISRRRGVLPSPVYWPDPPDLHSADVGTGHRVGSA
eukprot:334210-Rhodomonas_salina.5